MLRGSNIRIKVNGVLVALCTSCKISGTTNTESAAVKTDAAHQPVAEADWETPSIVSKSWSVTVDHLLPPDGANFADDKTMFLSNNAVTLSFDLGGFTFSGNVILSSDSLQGQNKQNSTSSITFNGNGALSYAAISA